MFQTLHTHCISLSIAGIRLFVECGLQPSPGLDLFQQLRLCPAVLQRGPEMPGALPAALTALQNRRILRPTHLQGQRQEYWVVGVGPAELPHPAQVPRGEAPAPRVVGLEILSGHHCRALLRAGADGPANLEVQLHLRELRSHELIQRSIHGAVLGPVFDLLEEVCQMVCHVVPGELEGNAGWGAVGEDVVHRPAVGVQVSSGLCIFLL